MKRVVALILAGGRGERLSILSEERAKPAVVFAGKYRIIDFTLSSVVHSGIDRVALLTQYRPRSLNQHVGIGKPWDLDRMGGGVFLLQPYEARYNGGWYRGTADAVYQNLYFVEESKADQVLILSGDHIYHMHYNEMVAFHREKKAECTVGVVEVPIHEASRYGILHVDEDGRIADFEEKPRKPKSNTASMGIYVFNKDVLMEKLREDANRPDSSHDFGKDVLPTMLGEYSVYGYRFEGYWRDVGTVQSYWEANMDLVSDLPQLNLYDREHPLLTRTQNRPPAKSGPRAHITRSLVCDGCIIDGTVYNSVLSPGVYIEEGAMVEESILFDDCYVERGARINRSILDKEVRVGRDALIGWGDNDCPNEDEPDHLSTGITIVGKQAVVPPATRIGRNCKIYPDTTAAQYASDTIPTGKSVGKKKR